MSDLDRLANMAEIISAIIVVGGVIFALLQMRQTRQQRRELAAIELFRSFGSPQFTEAYRNVLHYPDGLNEATMKRRFPDGEHYAMMIATTMENIGVMMYQRIVPSSVVSNLIGSTTIIMWRKLEIWTKDLRIEIGSPNAFEWFEWLADRMEEFGANDRAPAYDAHTDWKPSNLTGGI